MFSECSNVRYVSPALLGLSGLSAIRAVNHCFQMWTGRSIESLIPKHPPSIIDVVAPLPWPQSFQPEPMLLTRSDKERGGKAGMHYMFYKMQVRGFDSSDPLHDDWNQFHGAMADSGLTSYSLSRVTSTCFSPPFAACPTV